MAGKHERADAVTGFGTEQDTPWLSHMSTPQLQGSDRLDPTRLQRPSSPYDGAHSSTPNTTYAAFSPVTLSSTRPGATTAAKRRSTILVHQKSPLLLATPPQITRALAYSHPFLLPLNKLAGLVTWTTGEPWESFLVLAAFWLAVLYGDFATRVAGPVLLVVLLSGGMYSRRFSPLSSSGWGEPGAEQCGANGNAPKTTAKAKNLPVQGLPDKRTRTGRGIGPAAPGGGHVHNTHSLSEFTNTRHHKTLDEMVETLKELTARCNILLEPLLELTDFLSTQRSPTSATTRPALTTLFVRIVLCTPFWCALTLPPLHIITTRRVVLVTGSVFLTWHARVMRVARAIVWRSATVRRLLSLVTGLRCDGPRKPMVMAAAGAPRALAAGKAMADATAKGVNDPRESELSKALRRARGSGKNTGVRFTFIIYENQRRWVGLGWTTSLFAYERAAWTDEHNNAVPPRDQFELPDVEDGSSMRWQWVAVSRWRVDGVLDDAVRPLDRERDHAAWDYDGPGGRTGWVYYDNKWGNGRRGLDGWGRWTRRRKWYRDAELVEVEADESDETNMLSDDQAVRLSQETSRIPTSAATRASDAPSHSTGGHSLDLATPASTVTTENGKDRERGWEKGDDFDLASMRSSSSQSNRASPTLGRRIPDSSHCSGRLSGAASCEDDAAALGASVGLAIQGAGKEDGRWGIGDDVRMGLE